ncbi:hypothetical protein O5D80_007884 [Batrachochytrium dendrobatidis]|nr:hypothetical protein O5D80_007884 [Batrachochytrium dendrobatidis]
MFMVVFFMLFNTIAVHGLAIHSRGIDYPKLFKRGNDDLPAITAKDITEPKSNGIPQNKAFSSFLKEPLDDTVSNPKPAPAPVPEQSNPIPSTSTSVKSSDKPVSDTDTTVKSSNKPTSGASVKSSNTPISDTVASVKSSDAPTSGVSVKSSDKPVSDTVASVKSSDKPVSDTVASVKSSNTPTTATAVKGSDKPVSDTVASVKSPNTPTAATTVKGSDKPSTSTSVKSSKKPTPGKSVKSLKKPAPGTVEAIKQAQDKVTKLLVTNDKNRRRVKQLERKIKSTGSSKSASGPSNVTGLKAKLRKAFQQFKKSNQSYQKGVKALRTQTSLPNPAMKFKFK